MIKNPKGEERLALYKQGLSDKKIAGILGIPRDTFKTWRLRRKLPANYGRLHLNATEDGERRRLYDNGLSDNGIAKTRGLTKYAILKWRRARKLSPNKKYIEPTPSLNFTESLAYVLAVLYSDGWFTKRGFSFGLQVNEKRFAEYFHERLKEIELNSSFYFYEKTKSWRVFGSSKSFHKAFSNRDFSRIWEEIKEIESFQWAFLRGAYEAEGCVSLKSKGQSIRVELFCNQDSAFFSLIRNICDSLNLEYSVYTAERKNGMLQRLVLRGKTPSLVLFLEKFSPTIKNADRAKELLRSRIRVDQKPLKSV